MEFEQQEKKRSTLRRMNDDQSFVLEPARKSRRAKILGQTRLRCARRLSKVVGRIMLRPQAPKGQPRLWMIMAREIQRQFTIGIQRHANKRWRISKRDGWQASIKILPDL